MKKRSAMGIAGAIVLSLMAGMVSREMTLASQVRAAAPIIVRVAPSSAPASPGTAAGAEVRDG
jgi:hypothetical protein